MQHMAMSLSMRVPGGLSVHSLEFIFCCMCYLTNLIHNSFLCIYFSSLHVSDNLVLIIRRINCINTTSGIRHSVSVTVSCAGRTCTRNGHRHTVTYTRGCIDTIDSPDDEHGFPWKGTAVLFRPAHFMQRKNPPLSRHLLSYKLPHQLHTRNS